jgi:membrane-associated phospholipid phosphatase
MWLMVRSASLLGRHSGWDHLVQSWIENGIFGGYWFAGTLFVLWVLAQRQGPSVRRRIVTILIGSLFSVVAGLAATAVVRWPPPVHHPDLAHLYPGFLSNQNASSFPSQSTALYAAIAAGVWSLSRPFGTFLWFAVVAFVALPRIYVGGHYPTDVVAGAGIGVAAYFLARTAEGRMTSLDRWILEPAGRATVANVLIFGWILQVALEFGTWPVIRKSIDLIRGTGTLTLGGDRAFGQHFHGRIDEVRIYPRALSAEEIARDLDSANPVLGDQLVAAYSFEEGSGSRVADRSLHGNHGVVVNALWVRGRYGTALECNGIDSVVEIPDDPSLGLSNMTLVAWIYPADESTRWTDVIMKSVDRYFLEASSPEGPPAFGITTADGHHSIVYASSRLAVNQWSHVAGTYDGSKLRLYVNGTAAGQ